MAQQLQRSVIKILNQHGEIAGAGFVVGDRLAVTCAHVVQAAGSSCSKPVCVQFFMDESEQIAQVQEVGWSPPNDDIESQDDVAFLLLERLPRGVIPVILGTAEGCNGHDYNALGFASLANYECRWADDKLSGVVPVVGKRPMLQCKGAEIKQGMSGAPVLDTQTDRVVGMVSEYKDDEWRRFAWATTANTLVELNSALRLWPQMYGPRELYGYLKDLIKDNQTLTLPDGNDVELERIYVSLRADEMNAIERQAEHNVYLEDVAKLQKSIKLSSTDEYSIFAATWKTIAYRPTMLMLQARNWERTFGGCHPESCVKMHRG